MNAALLGLAHPHSAALLSSLENLPEIRRVWVWDDRPLRRRWDDLPRCRKIALLTPELERVLAEPGVEFAIVAVRHDRAAGLSRRVLEARKHLLAEKPVALTSAEIDALEAQAARAGVLAGVLYARRAHPVAKAAKRLVEAGRIGPLQSLEARFLATQVRFRNPGSWLFRRAQAGGGILPWLGCHYLDLLQHISGEEIVSVGARLAQRSGERIDVEDTAALVLGFASGAVGTFHSAYALAGRGEGYLNAAGYDAYLGINGRDGRVIWPGIAPELRVENSAGRAPVRLLRFPEPRSSSYAGTAGEAFLRAFIAAIRRGGEPPAPLSAAARTARIVEAAERSQRLGRFVSLRRSTAAPLTFRSIRPGG